MESKPEKTLELTEQTGLVEIAENTIYNIKQHIHMPMKNFLDLLDYSMCFLQYTSSLYLSGISLN